MKIQKIKIDELHGADYNPRKDLQPGDDEFESIRRSIETFGYVEPVIFNRRSGNIVGGNQRSKVLQALGYEDVDCVVVDLDDEREMALNIALNKVHGDWDTDKLEALLRQLDAACFDVSLTGFKEDELARMFRTGDLSTAEDDGFDEPLAEMAQTKPGDIWMLGRHRLLCGDATKSESYAALMGENRAALVVTDPPYNVAYQGKAGRIQNDCLPEAEFRAFLSAAFSGMAGVMMPGAAFYVFYSDSETVAFRQALEGAGLGVHQTCIWAKNAAVLGRSDYQNDYEPVLFGYEQDHETIVYGWENAGAHRWFADRKQHTVWHFDRPTKSKYHPTMKPLELLAYVIANSSMPGEVVLDPFSVSESVLGPVSK